MIKQYKTEKISEEKNYETYKNVQQKIQRKMQIKHIETDSIRRIKATLRKGSYTVEAIIVMGMTFLVLAVILYLSSFLYGRAVMTASAYEQAFTGRQHALGGLFGIEDIKEQISFTEQVNEVDYSGTCESVWGGYKKELVVAAKVKKIYPVTFIWQMQKIGEIIEKKE